MAGFAVQVQLARSAIEALGTVVEEARADNLPTAEVAAHLQQERLPAMLQEAEQTRRAGQVYRVIDGAVKMLFLMRKRLDTMEQEAQDEQLANAVAAAMQEGQSE